MNRITKVMLLLAGMAAMRYAAYAQPNACYAGGGDADSCHYESSAQRFALYYRNDRTDLDEDYLDNAVQMARIRHYLNESPHIDSITVYAYASPEGVYEHNVLLSKRRSVSARNYILSHLPSSSDFTADKIILRPMEENWDGLYEAVVRDYHRHDRGRVMAILESDVRNDTKKWRLQQLDNGNTYKYIIRNIMPRLRTATWVCVWVDPERAALLDKRSALPEPIEAAERVERPLAMPLALAPALMPATEPLFEAPLQPKAKRTILGLKTNMLYDAATALNFAIEGAINKNFSILYEHHCPWWVTKSNRYCLEILSFGGEFRWWFKPATDKYASRTDWVQRDALVGHFLGLYGFGGKFDVQAKRMGCYQGEFMSVGLTYGYSMPICKRLNLEFSLSVGYANIPYRHYIPTDDYQILVRDRNKQGRLHYVGPTKIEIALVVPILAPCKAKGGRR